jgi:hypothetical protein
MNNDINDYLYDKILKELSEQMSSVFGASTSTSTNTKEEPLTYDKLMEAFELIKPIEREERLIAFVVSDIYAPHTGGYKVKSEEPIGFYFLINNHAWDEIKNEVNSFPDTNLTGTYPNYYGTPVYKNDDFAREILMNAMKDFIIQDTKNANLDWKVFNHNFHLDE